jgi:hypothetical protein
VIHDNLPSLPKLNKSKCMRSRLLDSPNFTGTTTLALFAAAALPHPGTLPLLPLVVGTVVVVVVGLDSVAVQ